MPDNLFVATDDNPYSGQSVWAKVYADMRGTDWDEWTEHREVGAALCYAYKRTGSEDGVLATILATQQARNARDMSPVEICLMADHYKGEVYGSFDTPLQDHLDENYNGLLLQYLNERGLQQMEHEICRDSEVWIDDPGQVSGVWVFHRPKGW